MSLLSRVGRSSSWLVAVTAAAAACGSSKSGTLGGAGSGGDDGTSADGGTPGFGNPSAGDDASTGVFISGGDDGGGTSVTACASSVSKGQERNLDVYIMLDQSLSMLDDGKWTGVTAAINSFVTQPLTGVSVGIQYFALNLLSCTASDYATPEVEIAPLPGVASQITASLAKHVPSTVTPTVAAEQGAIDHAQTWSTAHPGDEVIVILATDGDPDSCNILPDPLTPVEQAAMAGFAGTPKIPTFVIGVGTDTMNLNAIAAAGGSGSAFIVDTTMNVQTQFLAALSKIRGSALGCQYKIPAPTTGSMIDYTKVNVQFTTNGVKTIFPQVASVSKCPASGNAWYYDNAASPTEIVLCTSTCGSLSVGGEVDVLTGCQTVAAK